MSRVGKAPQNKNKPAFRGPRSVVAKIFCRRQKLHNFELRTPNSEPRIIGEEGYAYVMVLAAVVILAILAATAYQLTSYVVKHDKEQELLFRGYSYERAIQSYYLSSPPGQMPTYPRRLEDLLSDPRYAHKRHLRALYPDPFGGTWNLVKSSDGGIAGVASPSKEKPLKQSNFPPVFSSFEGAQHYSDWIFAYQPGVQLMGGTGANPFEKGLSSPMPRFE